MADSGPCPDCGEEIDYRSTSHLNVDCIGVLRDRIAALTARLEALEARPRAVPRLGPAQPKDLAQQAKAIVDRLLEKDNRRPKPKRTARRKGS